MLMDALVRNFTSRFYTSWIEDIRDGNRLKIRNYISFTFRDDSVN